MDSSIAGCRLANAPVANSLGQSLATCQFCVDEGNPPYEYPDKTDYYNYYKYGELAREGINCTICHHINGSGSTPAGKLAMDRFLGVAKQEPHWLPDNPNIWSDNFIYFLAAGTALEDWKMPLVTATADVPD